MAELPDPFNVLVAAPIDQATIDRIEAVAPGRVKVYAIWDDLQPELAEEWPPETMARRGSKNPPTRSREELEAIVQAGNAVIIGVPWPIAMPSRMPNLIWGHLPAAGVSNLKGTPWWEGKAVLTSARGSSSAIPIAESAIAGAFMLARRLEVAVRQTDARALDPQPYGGTMRVLHGKTMGIVGMGGIGREVARMARGVGMRVIATRHSAKERQFDVDEVDVLMPPSETHDLLAESDFICVCAMWTPETEKMLDRAAFDAVKPGAYFLNIARGEIVDELAMVDALKDGRLGGAYIDVWWDDTSSLPLPELISAPNLIMTPHVSGGADGDYRGGMTVFCENLDRLLKGEPMLNIVDWERGY
ncbi:MAG: NAD(P)-dependent oxidoreductase [Dehalococcoidia bacterium]